MIINLTYVKEKLKTFKFNIIKINTHIKVHIKLINYLYILFNF